MFALLYRFVLIAAVAVSSIISFADTLGPYPHQRSNLPQMANATVGKYLYVGTAPKFNPEDLLLVSSKIGLTLRVQASVTQNLIDTYAKTLYQRFNTLRQYFEPNSDYQFVPYKNFNTLYASSKRASTQLWLKVAQPYLGHVLEAWANPSDFENYNTYILTAVLRYYFQNPYLTLAQTSQLESVLNHPAFLTSLSRQLFKTHLSSQYTELPTSQNNESQKYVGILTYVYPIAATTEGPFDEPSEGVRDFGLEGNVEARIWSDKWKDEFGGFPFLLINWAGVAFHGPITNFAPLDTWYLRRGYVSHGCHRMDASDILELRALLPNDLSLLQKKKKAIRHVTLTWPDVTDWNLDGQLEVMDAGYYEIPTYFAEPKKGADLDKIAASYMGENAKEKWRKKIWVPRNKHPDSNGLAYYDEGTQLYSGLPKYNWSNGKLTRNGNYGALPVKTFEEKPNRILQYQDGKALPRTYDLYNLKSLNPFL